MKPLLKKLLASHLLNPLEKFLARSQVHARKLQALTREIDLTGVLEAGKEIIEGQVRGRVVVKVS